MGQSSGYHASGGRNRSGSGQQDRGTADPFAAYGNCLEEQASPDIPAPADSFVAIDIVLVFKSVDIASRGAAADDSLLMLALSCFFAGVHINWAYMPVSMMLAVMAVGLGYLDQTSLYLLVIPLAILTVWVSARYKLR